MKTVFEEPPDDGQWRVGSFGLTPLSSRVANYSGLVLFLAINALVWVFAQGPLLEAMALIPRWQRPVVGVLSLTALMTAHEAVHVLFHPDIGRSSRTIAGIRSFGPFVLYNGPMSYRRFVAYLLGPLVVLTPLLTLLVFLSGKVWPLALNLLTLGVASTFGDLALALRFVRQNRGCSEVWNAGRRMLVR